MSANQIIQLRNTTASQWRSINPVLALGEVGWEKDTGQYKVGNGSTVWASLPYGGIIGSTPTSVIEDFGDGSDGSVTLSAGLLTLVKDTYFNNLTINGTGGIITSGYRLFISGTLNITAAGANAIQWNGNMGNPGTSAGVGGSAPAAQNATNLGGATVGVIGGAGNTTAGSLGTNGIAATTNGGAGANGGSGGAGTNAGGVGGTGGAITASLPIRRWCIDFIRGITQLQGSAGSASGAGAGGDGTNKGGGGGSSANGGGHVSIYVNTINRGSSTAVGCISSNGGIGGFGGTPTTGIAGGGGGGGGGSGGSIYIVYNTLTGSTGTNIISSSGGTGGTGGSGFGGNGSTTGTGGVGGSGGAGGRITLLQVSTGTGSEVFGSAGTAGGAQSAGTGGSGGAGNTNQVSL